MTYKEIKNNREVLTLIEKGNANLGILGYTDHSKAHSALVAEQAGNLLQQFGYSEHDIELVKIASFLHDIGNAVNRTHHAEYGAIIAGEILRQTDMPLADRVQVMSAISNHDESTGSPVDAISAALIIADKTDVRRNRVRTTELSAFDIHDRVNYAVTNSHLRLDKENNIISLNLQVDESICTMYEYFDIFLARMQMCRHAAGLLGKAFRLSVNGSKVL